jgi:hypothetical protein
MSSLNDFSLKRQLAPILLNHIIEKMLECFNRMRQDCERKLEKLVNSETVIRDYFFLNYLNNDSVMQDIGFDDFRFFSEVPENYINNTPTGRTDLQVFNIEQFRHREQYFTIECKRVDGNLTLNRAYIDQGMRRFLGKQPKYPSYYKMNGMMGFVIRNIDINNNVNRINKLLRDNYTDLHVQDYLHAGTIPHTFLSSHGEDPNEQITLIHAFSNCASLIY